MIEALHNLVKEMSSGDEKETEIHKCLNLEIRFRKYKLNEVKKTCPLFRQKGLSVQQKVKNLEALIDSQLAFKALATMDDLELAINDACTQEISVDDTIEEDEADNATRRLAVRDGGNPTESSNPEQFKINEYVLVLFEDGAYPCVIKTITDTIEVHCLNPLLVCGKEDFHYWKWPSTIEKQFITVHSVLLRKVH